MTIRFPQKIAVGELVACSHGSKASTKHDDLWK